MAGFVKDAGWMVVNIDITVIAEAPKINPHVAPMRIELGRCLELDGGAISLKATTNEGMGFIGRGEGIGAIATAMIAPLNEADVPDGADG